MTRTITTTHYEAITESGEKVTGEVLTSMTGRKLKKYIEKVHGIKATEISFRLTSDEYELSVEDFVRYATKVEK